ncbi:unnamed protein product [Somion occarium]|uniref:Fungal-type protein kinase domain-containing protein n=1 Tax=Somion occarium TaxID=3059160 RepID=A0ABP1DZE0_9APHY
MAAAFPPSPPSPLPPLPPVSPLGTGDTTPYLGDRSDSDLEGQSVSVANAFPDSYFSSRYAQQRGEEGIPEEWKHFYREEYRGKVKRDVPIVDFVKSVYKFGVEDIPTPPCGGEGGYKLLKEPLDAYLGSISRTRAPWGIYNTFQKLLESVLDQIPDECRPFDGRFSLTVPTAANPFLPTIVWSTIDHPTVDDMDFLALFVDVRKSERSYRSMHDISVDLNEFDDDEQIVYEVRKLAWADKPLDDIDLKSIVTLNELMSYGVREYNTGIQVQDTSICLWYGDRFGVVKSAPFDFLREPHLLVLVLAALSSAKRSDLGFSPFMKNPGQSFDNYDRAALVLDNAIDANNQSTGQVAFRFDVNEEQDRKIYTQYGAMGRGTTVIPVKTLRMVGTTTDPDEPLVAKLCWPYSGTNEDSIIRRVRIRLQAKAPEYLKHIVELKCTLELTMEETNLPRVFMTDDNSFHMIGHVFKVMVMKSYLPLEQLTGPDEFLQVWYDVVSAHHWVFKTSKIIHHDISNNNVMFFRDPIDGVVGVLCDWDLSEKVFPGQCIKPGRTGTTPFMAIAMLSDEYPGHEYQHDLESFFWLFVWFVTNHNPDKKSFSETLEWTVGNEPRQQASLANIGAAKAHFIDVHRAADPRIYERMHPCYRPLLQNIFGLRTYLFAHRLFNYRCGELAVSHETEQVMKGYRDIKIEQLFWAFDGVKLQYEAFIHSAFHQSRLAEPL